MNKNIHDIKRAPCIPPRIGLVLILIRWVGSKQKYYVTSNNMDSKSERENTDKYSLNLRLGENKFGA